MMCLWSPAGGTAVRAAADRNLIGELDAAAG